MTSRDLTLALLESAAIGALLIVVRQLLRRWLPRAAVISPYVGIGVFFLGYSLLRAATLHSLPTALANARRVEEFEGPAGAWLQSACHAMVAWQPAWTTAVIFYSVAHIAVTVAATATIVVSGRPAEMLPLGIATVVAVVVFAVFPTASPAVAAHGATPVPGVEAVFAAPYAALPSLHCTWALWSSQALWSRTHHSAARVALVLYPAVVVVVVLGTRNHWALDAAAGLALAAASTPAAWVLHRQALRLRQHRAARTPRSRPTTAPILRPAPGDCSGGRETGRCHRGRHRLPSSGAVEHEEGTAP